MGGGVNSHDALARSADGDGFQFMAGPGWADATQFLPCSGHAERIARVFY